MYVELIRENLWFFLPIERAKAFFESFPRDDCIMLMSFYSRLDTGEVVPKTMKTPEWNAEMAKRGFIWRVACAYEPTFNTVEYTERLQNDDSLLSQVDSLKFDDHNFADIKEFALIVVYSRCFRLKEADRDKYPSMCLVEMEKAGLQSLSGINKSRKTPGVHICYGLLSPKRGWVHIC